MLSHDIYMRIQMQHKSDSHLLMQPFGQIPVLELEDHQYLFESRAITQFLARRYADRGTPRESIVSSCNRQAEVWLAVHVHGLMAKAFYEEALSIEAFDFGMCNTACAEHPQSQLML